jgi:hypothetical protein
MTKKYIDTTTKTVKKLRWNMVFIRNMKMWKFALVVGATQSRKTTKAFDILSNQLQKCKGKTLILFVTQSNSVMSAYQLLNRVKLVDGILEKIPKNNIMRCNGILPKNDENMMIVDFYNSKNTTKMINIASKYDWNDIIVILDSFIKLIGFFIY